MSLSLQYVSSRSLSVAIASTVLFAPAPQASGNLGLPITLALVNTGRFTVLALTRRASAPSLEQPAAVSFMRADYANHDAFVAALRGQGAVICAISTSNLIDQRVLIDAAAEPGVKWFLPSKSRFDTQRADVLEVAPCCVLERDPVERLQG